MKLLYLKNSDWEEDYIINDLCSDIKNLEVIFYKNDEVKNLMKYINDKIILVLNDRVNFEEAKEVVEKIKPLIIIFLSDENGNHINYVSLSSNTKLFLKQYHHNLINKNIFQIPLGYVKGMLNGKESEKLNLIKIKDRKYKWCFIGTLKSDRTAMLKSFLDKISNSQEDVYLNVSYNPWIIENLPSSPKDVFEKYSNSIFIPIGRGNISLDCFRI